MRILFYDDPVAHTGPSIFLAGPTAGAGGRTAWRAQALALLSGHGFDGTVLIPEFHDTPFADAAPRRFGAPPSPVPRMKATTYNILRWETGGIEGATVVLFWMPFVIGVEGDPASLPGFTTRAEVGRELARAPHRLVLGMPTEDVVSGGHIRYHAHHHGVTIHDSLEATVLAAITRCAG